MSQLKFSSGDFNTPQIGNIQVDRACERHTKTIIMVPLRLNKYFVKAVYNHYQEIVIGLNPNKSE